ncbi:FAD-dependent monooxygenase [Streptomyces sp. M19]
MSEETDVVVVGAGQAGVAMSEHLGAHGVPHIVLERHRIAERWRSERWDSLVANGPAWHDRFPGLEFPDVAPDAFASKNRSRTTSSRMPRRSTPRSAPVSR